MTDYTENFRCSETMSKQIDILYKLHGFDSKSEYIRHLIASDLERQQEKAGLYGQLLALNEGDTRKDR